MIALIGLISSFLYFVVIPYQCLCNTIKKTTHLSLDRMQYPLIKQVFMFGPFSNKEKESCHTDHFLVHSCKMLFSTIANEKYTCCFTIPVKLYLGNKELSALINLTYGFVAITYVGAQQ